MSTPDDLRSIDVPLRLLDWYRAMGVDNALGEEAIDWHARGTVKPGADFVLPAQAPASAVKPLPPAPPPAIRHGQPPLPPVETRERRAVPAAAPPQPSRAFAATSPDAAVAAARAAAAAAATLDALGQAVATFDGCGLKATAKSLCYYRGASHARLMIIGEAPSRDDDLAGTPFTGPAGALLDLMLAAIGMGPDTCHITNAVYWRPPGNRTPTPQEVEVCRPFIERQIALVRPSVLLLLGATAAKAVLDIGDSLGRARGAWKSAEFGGHAVRAMVTYNPNYLLKMPSHKQQVWRDLLAVKAACNGG